MCQARGLRQGVLGRQKSGSLRISQADRLRPLRAANEQVCEWLEDPVRRWEETEVEVDGAQESLQFADVGRLGVGEHRLPVAAQGLDPGGLHLVAQELDGSVGEHALLCVDDQACIAQARKKLPSDAPDALAHLCWQ